MRNLIIIFFALLSVNGIAQQNSPYSRFGVGQHYPSSTATSRAMGNISTAFADTVDTNLNNPANLGNKLFSSIDFGLNANYKTQKDQNNSTNFAEGGISYLSYSFPVIKKNYDGTGRVWGMAIGVQPLTYKGYDITSDIIDNRYIREYEGDGNTYKLFWQNGVEISKGLNIGIDAGVLFGSLEDKTYNTFLSSTALSSGQTTQQKLRGILLNLGGQYTTELKEDLKLTLGSTYGLNSKLNNEVTVDNFQYTVTLSEVNDNGKIDIIKRNIVNRQEAITTNQEITYPQQIGFGAYMDKKEKWSLGIDAKMGQWSEFKGTNDDTSQSYKNSLDLSLGGSFIPNYRNPGKAYESFEYRYGGYYNQTYLTVAGTDIQDYGITLGVGLPAKRNIPGARVRQIPSSVDVGIVIGQTGTIENNLVQDSYIKGTIGLNLNDIWFEKKKYD